VLGTDEGNVEGFRDDNILGTSLGPDEGSVLGPVNGILEGVEEG